MGNFKKLTLAAAISSAVVLTGCGGSSGGSSNDGNTGGQTVSGTASAPGGQIAQFEPQNVFEVAMDFFVSPAAAAITGLDPVKGADVELIRVDDQGNQIGEVLATTTTSITGDYKLTLPQGVNLAGNLVVRITGQNNNTLRAQVVEQEVDISPVSEFVLRKFIETGADLDELVVDDIVKLSGRVEEFDLVAGANLEQMFGILEEEVGDFIENEVAVAAGGKGDAGTVVGNYRNSAFGFGLHDNEASDFGTFAVDHWVASLTFADGGDSTVNITLAQEEDHYGSLSGPGIANSGVTYETELEEDINETFPGTLTGSGILSIPGEFEEDIDGDYGWRYPGTALNLVQVADKGLFFILTNEAAVRYVTVDTDGDGEKDALDPDQKNGDEVFRSLEVMARQPANFTDADLSGKFGRVFIESWLESGTAELQTEVNTLTFDGNGHFDYDPVIEDHGHLIKLTTAGASYQAITDTKSEGEPVIVTPDGDITHIGTEDDGVTPAAADGFINDTFDFIVVSEANGVGNSGSQNESEASQTLLIKLPTSAPAVAGNKYRVQLMSMKLGSNEQFLLSSSKFNTFLTMTSQQAATIDGNFMEVEKNGLAGQLSTETYKEEGTAVVVDIAADGATTLTIDGDEGTTTLDGFFNADASLGIFALSWAATDSDPDELGLVVLTKSE